MSRPAVTTRCTSCNDESTTTPCICISLLCIIILKMESSQSKRSAAFSQEMSQPLFEKDMEELQSTLPPDKKLKAGREYIWNRKSKRIWKKICKSYKKWRKRCNMMYLTMETMKLFSLTH
ncbi:uncharacterized protein LOC110681674 isoform X2 [Chenopodium quinoa]|uniref:uncharacterized protein LOC110681674 isoform X2 n=1 Tax=Chenopodium quinoa TaxID=63459 RepID=UPI000B780009|nr:uncharacterized protein LOC110681674 isoform X2 [Chenopodium quinoa]